MAIITRRRDFVLSSRDGAHGRVTSPGHCGRSSVGAGGWEPVAAGRLDLPSMARRQLPPVAAVISFIDCINRGDTDGLGLLMTDDHEPAVFDEEPLRGKEPNIEAWNGYATAFPDYVIYPRVVAEPGQGQVAVLGHTTGSHLGLSDQEERSCQSSGSPKRRTGACAAGACCCYASKPGSPTGSLRNGG